MDLALDEEAISVCANQAIDTHPTRMVHSKENRSKSRPKKNMRRTLTVYQSIVSQARSYILKFILNNFLQCSNRCL